MDSFLVWVLFALAGMVVVLKKGRRGWGWFVLILFLGPLGLILALFIPNKKRPYDDNAPFDLDE